MNISYLKTKLKTRNISIYKLSKLADLDDGMLNRIIKGKTTKPQMTTVVKIAKALDLNYADIERMKKNDNQRRSNELERK